MTPNLASPYWDQFRDKSQEPRLKAAVEHMHAAEDAYKYARRLSNIKQRTPAEVEGARLRYVAATAEYHMAYDAYWIGA